MKMLFLLLLPACGHQGSSSSVGAPGAGEQLSVQLGRLPEDAAIVFTSMRWKQDRDGAASWELYVMDGNGEQTTRMSFQNRTYEHAAVSQDHRLIVASSREKGFLGGIRNRMWLYDLETGTERQILPGFHRAGVGGVDFSPDGFIYFAGSPGRSRETDVFKVRPDGAGLERLTETPEMESDVSISEDGSMVAYVRVMRRERGLKPQVWIMSAEGSGQRMIHDGGPEIGFHTKQPIGAFDPEFSPDNRRLVFSLTNSRSDNFGFGAHDICAIDADGTDFEVLTPGVGSIQMIPDWVGGRLLYTEYNERKRYVGIVTMDPDGGNSVRLQEGLSEIWDGGRHAKWIPPLDPEWPRARPED